MIKELPCAEIASLFAAETISSHNSSSDLLPLNAPETLLSRHSTMESFHASSNVKVANHLIKNVQMRLCLFARRGFVTFIATQACQVM